MKRARSIRKGAHFNTASAWASTADRYPDDTLLRENGFRIHSRPDVGSALWIFADKIFTQAEALDFVRSTGEDA